MPLKFEHPKPNVVYSNKKLDDLQSLDAAIRNDIELLLKILPKEDELHSYIAPITESLENYDWFEFGIAVVRNNKIIVISKIEEYHDCGVY